MSRLAVALRVARRDARRSKGRSALVVAMIALPVLGVSSADVLWRTFQLDEEQQAARLVGGADGQLEDSGGVTVEQYPGGTGYASTGDARRGQAVPDPASVVPAGSRLVPRREGSGVVVTADARSSVSTTDLPLGDPLVGDLLRLRSGRAPHGADEAAVTEALADRLGLRLGDRVTVEQGRASSERTLVGLVQIPSSVGQRAVVLPPDQLVGPSTTRWLVDVPGTLTWADVERANAQGFVLQTRGHVPGEPAVPQQAIDLVDSATVTAVTLVVGMALLEVVLLAGPAFAVGAKRRTRDLALLSATGAESRDVRATVLGGGVVLGLLGGVVGVAGGTALAWAALPWATRVNDALPGPFDVRPLELLGLVAVGVVTALLAALLPAWAASRVDVVAGLTGRRGAVRSRRSTPVLGLLAAGGGAALALEGARQRSVNTILAGSAVAELGLVATTPALVGLVGRLGRWLPLAPRLALRDAARHRGRSAPAVSAVLAAVAGSVAVGTYVASLDRHDRDAYTPSAPYGSTWAFLNGGDSNGEAAAGVLREQLPGARVTVVRGLGQGFDPAAGVPTRYAALTSPCGGPCQAGEGYRSTSELQVGDAQLLRDLSGVDVPDEVAAVLAAGGAVVPEDAVRPGGVAVVNVETPHEDGTSTSHGVTLPAVGFSAGLPVAVVSPATAERIGAGTHVAGVFAATTSPPSGRTEDRIRAGLERVAADSYVQVERGYVSNYGFGLLALLVGSAVIVLGASSIATGLAAADGRADLATLAAVGATPVTRRVLAAFQSFVTAGLGTVLGVVAGLVPAVAILRAVNSAGALRHAVPLPIVVPWTNVAVTLLVVPLLAAGAAGLLTRSRLPLVRRLA